MSASCRTNNKFVNMRYSIHYYSDEVEAGVLALPKTLLARYFSLTDRMISAGAHLGEPHTKALGNGLFELRLKGAEGIARVLYCTQVGRRLVMLHSFVKKTEKTPITERRIATARLKEIHHAHS